MSKAQASEVATLCRTFLSTFLQTMTSSLTDAEFEASTRAVLAAIEAQLDQWLEDDVVDIDMHRTGGLLELTMPAGSKIVINTQPPLHELWLASKSGGWHFQHQARRWIDTRAGLEFFELLSRELTHQAGRSLQVRSPS